MQSDLTAGGIALVRYGDVDDLCTITVDGGTEFTLNVSTSRLEAAFAEQGASLPDLCERRRVEVFCVPTSIGADEWNCIVGVVHRDPAGARLLRETPALSAIFELTFDAVCCLPCAVYGGLAHTPDQGTIYLHPFPGFRRVADGRGTRWDPPEHTGWYYALAPGDGGFLAKMWVNTQTSELRLETGVVRGHFVEGDPT
jgi:hypothetical protein